MSVKAKPDYRLVVGWSDGSTTTHDLSPVVQVRNWAAPLRDVAVFAGAKIAMDGREIVWPGTDIEFSANGLWEDIHPPATPPASWMSADEFRAWMKEMDFTWDGAAEALAISRRTIGNYLSGNQEIPKTVWLACMQLAARKSRREPSSVAARGARRRKAAG